MPRKVKDQKDKVDETDWTDELEDTLITTVYNTPAIWDKTHSSHKNNYHMAKQWMSVATHMDMDKEVVRNKWRALQAIFTKETAKLSLLRSGAGADEVVKSSWVHYPAMQFIRDQVTRKSSGNFDLLLPKDNVPPQRTQDAAKNNSIKPQSTSGIKRKAAETKEPTSASDSSSRKAMTFDESDWNYFLSLVPYVSSIEGKKNKLKFRTEAQFTLIQFFDEKKETVEVKEEMIEPVYISDDEIESWIVDLVQRK